MNSFDFRRYALSCAIFAMLAACGGSQLPISAPGAIPQSAARPGISAQRNADRSWMAPDAATQDLLYAGTVRSVTIYSYPQGKLVGKLNGFYDVGSVCADTNGHVFVTNFAFGNVYEYAHGSKKRLRTLKTPAGGQPLGCAVDATTGNLAVAIYQHTSTGRGSVEIYAKARGKPHTYQSSAFEKYYYCGYDRNGNLFVDGLSYPRSGDFVLGELPKGASQIKTITVNQYIGWPGGVQWEKHLAVTDPTAPAIYRFAINGRHGSRIGTTPLGGNPADFFGESWIQGNTVLAPALFCGKKHTLPCIPFYVFPKGGKPFKSIPHGEFDAAESATVSLASPAP